MMSRYLVGGLALAGIAALAGCAENRPSAPHKAEPLPAARVAVDPEVADFYRARGNRPLWVAHGRLKPEALALAVSIGGAADHGLDPERYGARDIETALGAAAHGDTRALARAELLLSRGLTRFVRDLRTPVRPTGLKYIEPELAPAPPSPRALLDGAAAASSLSDFVADAVRVNPLYDSLHRGYARWRVAAPRLPEEERLVLANLDRARAIPGRRGRYIIVDAGSARLWMIEGNRIEAPMPVIVGKAAMATPALASSLRFVVLKPWWNVPPDLARERARKVLREGPMLLARERLEILSDWSDRARVIKASQVDWQAVASGRRTLRLRQRPGGSNVMGEIKFMMPNELGIYLHDFPEKALFARADRRLSSGCVRVSDAPRLARWLFRGDPPRPKGTAPEQDVDLPEPVPVYITYLTALPDPARGIALRPDPYRRDAPLLAAAAGKARKAS
jgi:murein L,D-transpeptidase YcbB/YkuD